MTTDELIVMRLQDIRICDIGLRRVAAKRIKALTAERDAAYAQGYADAETEISKSALGQKNAFLLSQYVNAATSIKDLNELLEEAQTEWSKYASSWMAAEGKLADAEALIEAQAKDHASNNIRFAEAEHRAKTAEVERDLLREALWAILACETPNANATVTRMASITKAALKGESHD